MNREILFRGKRKDNGEWIEGDIHKNLDFSKAHIHPIGERVRSFDVIPETVGHYTGLCDRNGTKIFEGDIIEYEEQDGAARYSIVWNEKSACFAVAGYEGMIIGDFAFFVSRKCEVIGNIHENLGLPEEENEP